LIVNNDINNDILTIIGIIGNIMKYQKEYSANNNLVDGFNPFEKYESQMGSLFPIYEIS